MEDKSIDLSDFFLSVKRTELLLEEIIFQQILTRNPGMDLDKANEIFNKALQNVSDAMKQHFESLKPLK